MAEQRDDPINSAAFDDTSTDAHANADTLRPGPLSEAVLVGAANGMTTDEASSVPSTYDYTALVGLLASYAVLIVGNGLLSTLVPVRMVDSGVSMIGVGLVQSCYYIGFVLGAVFNRSLIERVGQHRTFVAYSAGVAVLALAFAAFESTWVFALLRLLAGFAFMGIFTSVESWLNGGVPNALRGRIFGVYLSINYLAQGAGQFLLSSGDSTGDHPFLRVAAFFSASVIPVTLMNGWPVRLSDERLKPQQRDAWRATVNEMQRAAPLAVPGCILAGFLYSSFYAMVPVYLTRIGFSVENLSEFMGVALIGALALQWPMGKFSDRFDRALLVSKVAMLSAVLSGLLIVVRNHVLIGLILFLYVAVSFTLYGLIVSHVNDRTSSERRVATSAMLLILFSIGGVSGPPIASFAMTVLTPAGLFVFDCLTSIALAFAAIRVRAAAKEVG
jgi:MFS family permease